MTITNAPINKPTKIFAPKEEARLKALLIKQNKRNATSVKIAKDGMFNFPNRMRIDGCHFKKIIETWQAVLFKESPFSAHIALWLVVDKRHEKFKAEKEMFKDAFGKYAFCYSIESSAYRKFKEVNDDSSQ